MIDTQDSAVIKTVLTDSITASKKAHEADPKNILIEGSKLWVQYMERALEHFTTDFPDGRLE